MVNNILSFLRKHKPALILWACLTVLLLAQFDAMKDAVDAPMPAPEQMYWFRMVAAGIALAGYYTTVVATGSALLPAKILFYYACINLCDEIVGMPGRIEPHEFIIAIGLFIYETVKYYRRRKRKEL